MLNKSQSNRITNLSQIKSNTWFNNFSWENLISLEMNVPYTPKKIEIDQNKTTSSTYLNYLKVIIFNCRKLRNFPKTKI